MDAGVTHYSGLAENAENLAAANAGSARHIIVIADEPFDARSDAHTYDILSRLDQREARPGRVVVAEVVDDANRKRILEVGATTTMRPIRAYPELVVRALAAPGVEQVLENLFTHESDHLARFNATFENLRWGDVVMRFVAGGAGIPMGYVDGAQVYTNPHHDDICSGTGVVTLVDEHLTVTPATVASCLTAAAEGTTHGS